VNAFNLPSLLTIAYHMSSKSAPPSLAEVVKYNFAIDTSGLVSVLTDMTNRVVSLEKSREEMSSLLKVSQNASEQLRLRVTELEGQLAAIPGATERTCSSIVNASISKLPKFAPLELFEAKGRQTSSDMASITEELEKINDKIGAKKDGEKALSDKAEKEVRMLIAADTVSCVRTVPDLVRLESSLMNSESTSNKLLAARSIQIKAIENDVSKMMVDLSKANASFKSSSEVMAEIKMDSLRAFEAVALLQEKAVSGPKQMMQKMVDDLDKQLRNFTVSSVQDVEATITTMDEKITELFTTKANHQQIADSVNSALKKATITSEVEAIRAALSSLSDQVSAAAKNEISETESDSLKKLEKSLSKLKNLLDEKLDKTVFEESKSNSGEKEKDEVTAYMVSTGLQKCMSCNRPLPSEVVQRGSKAHVVPGVDAATADSFPHVHFAENVDLLRETALVAPLSRNKFHENSHSKTHSEILHAKMALSMAEQGVVPKQIISSPLTYSILHGKQAPPQSPANSSLWHGNHDSITPLPDHGIDRTFRGIVPVSNENVAQIMHHSATILNTDSCLFIISKLLRDLAARSISHQSLKYHQFQIDSLHCIRLCMASMWELEKIFPKTRQKNTRQIMNHRTENESNNTINFSRSANSRLLK
jgi:hypothetical protein